MNSSSWSFCFLSLQFLFQLTILSKMLHIEVLRSLYLPFELLRHGRIIFCKYFKFCRPCHLYCRYLVLLLEYKGTQMNMTVFRKTSWFIHHLMTGICSEKCGRSLDKFFFHDMNITASAHRSLNSIDQSFYEAS